MVAHTNSNIPQKIVVPNAKHLRRNLSSTHFVYAILGLGNLFIIIAVTVHNEMMDESPIHITARGCTINARVVFGFIKMISIKHNILLKIPTIVHNFLSNFSSFPSTQYKILKKLQV